MVPLLLTDDLEAKALRIKTNRFLLEAMRIHSSPSFTSKLFKRSFKGFLKGVPLPLLPTDDPGEAIFIECLNDSCLVMPYLMNVSRILAW